MGLKAQYIGPVYGAIAGIGMLIFTYITYRGGVEAYLGGTAYLGYAMLIGLAAAATLAQKKASGGYLDFRAALKTAFTVFVIALAAQTIFICLLLNVFDTNFKSAVAKIQFKRTEAFIRKLGKGRPQDQVDQAIADEKGKDQFSPGRMSMGLAFAYIVHFIIALLIAAIVKSKKPAQIGK